MNKLTIIALCGLLFACGTQKTAITKESSSNISSKDYPYIEKFYKALRLKANGRLDEAAELLNQCLQTRQDDDAVFYALSQIELLRGNEDMSAKHIEEAAKLDPKNTWYIQELAYMYFERGNFTGSVINFKKLVEIEPRNIDWLYGYAEALSRSGKFVEAIDALNKTEDRTGPHPELTLQKYRLYMNASKVAEGEQELLKGLEKFPQEPSIIANLVDHYFRTRQEAKAIDMLKKLVEADPSNGRAHLALSEVYLHQNKFTEAVEEVVKAMPAEDADLDSKMKVLIALHDKLTNAPENLLQGLDQLIATHPEQAKPYSIKGDFLLKAERDEEALEAYRRALQCDKNQYPIWNQVLIMSYQMGQFDDLYSDSKACLELFPTISTVYLLNGVSCNQLKKYEEAEDVLATGLELAGADKAMKAEFYGQLGEAAFGKKKYVDARMAYEKALELAPNSNLLKNNYAFRLAYHKRDLQLAESLIKQVFQNGGEQVQYKDTYALILMRQGKLDDALNELNAAFESMKDDKLVLEHLGDVFALKGDLNKAVDYWKRSQEAGNKDEILQKKISDKKYVEPF